MSDTEVLVAGAGPIGLTAAIELTLPADVPFGFVLIPQYETERILAEELAMHGVPVELGARLVAHLRKTFG